ncbi:MAG: hypothetical protein ACRCUI_01445, partial [Polymorphobacter sp.]
MLKTLAEILREHPELALFLALAIGYAIGRLKLFGFTPGAVTGCLLAGVAIGQFGVVISPDVQHAFFLLFLFAIGYRVGPQFIGSFDKDMLPQVYVTLVLCITGLAVSWACARLFGFDVGTAAGMLAGGLTESAAVGTAQGALRALPLPPAQLALMEANLASAFAVAYLAGTIGAIIFLSQIAPRLLPRPLTEACRAIEVELGLVTGDGHDSSARRDIELRAFRLADASKAQTIAQAEARVPAQFRAFILRVRRGDTILDGVPGLQLQVDDIVAVAGQRGYLVEAGVRIGSEVDDIELLDVPSETVDVVLTQRDLVGQTLEQLRQLPEARSIFLRSMTRSGEILPVLPGLRVLRGDIFRIEGSKRHVADAAARIGFADRPGNATDMVYVGVFIVLGGLLGIPALQLGGVDIGLGVAVGVLVGGIVAGWLRSVQRAYGFVPEP